MSHISLTHPAGHFPALPSLRPRWTFPRPRAHLEEVPDHLRRDVGLPEAPGERFAFGSVARMMLLLPR